MAEGLVVGIFPESDAKALESALSAQHLDLSKVKVVSGKPGAAESSQLEFVDVMADMEDNSFSDDMTKGLGIMGDSGGTSVPGISSPSATLGSFTSQGGGSKRYFAGFPIPDDEIDNFGDAVAEGRTVVLYTDAGAQAEAIAAAFKAAGLRNVRAY